MSDIVEAISAHPPGTALLAPALGPQKFAIASTRHRYPALYESDRSIAQLVGLPGAIGDALPAEQCFRDNAITTARAVRVKRTDRSTQALAPLFG